MGRHVAFAGLVAEWRRLSPIRNNDVAGIARAEI